MENEIRETEFQSNVDVTITKRSRNVEPPGPGVYFDEDFYAILLMLFVYF